MRAADVVERLQSEVLKRTGLFSTDIPIVSLTRSGSTVTAISAAPHNLINDQEVLIAGARELNPISLTFANGVVSAITQNVHDLTVPTRINVKNNNIYPFNQAVVSGANESEYNGAFTIESAVNRKSFTYAISGTPASPATGLPVLEHDFGYNGRFPVTVIDPVTFTYQITTTPASPAGGVIIGRSPARISSASSLQTAMDSYTKQNMDQFWMFVILGDVTTSRDRRVLSDATNEFSKQNEFRARLLEPFFVYVFVPAKQDLSGAMSRDNMEAIRGVIYHSLLGVIFPTALTDDTWSQTSPLGDRHASEVVNAAIYVHEFSFQRVVDVTYRDTKGPDINLAFRDVSLTIKSDQGTGELSADINLDEQPI